ncbi:MAG: hypothetical protein D6B25_20210 [Desulfobulbaceae bacterium]|nr:MAG: hypothetical protein D6B25_20210 [Desulfobulbaceae bacterium]
MEKSSIQEQAISSLNIGELRGKQSVRATFRLSDRMIDLLKVAANHLEVKQKSLIDEIIQDRQTLEKVALNPHRIDREEADRRQKTFVLSRSALDSLDYIARKHDLSRDHLVELCIGRLVPLVDAEQEKHAVRRAFMSDVERYLDQGKQLLQEAKTQFDQDDNFRRKLTETINSVENGIIKLRKSVKGEDSLTY